MKVPGSGAVAKLSQTFRIRTAILSVAKYACIEGRKASD